MTVKTARTSHGTARAKSLNFFWNGENGTDNARYDYCKYFECFYRNYGRDTAVRASSRHGHGENFKSFHSNYGTDVTRSRTFHSHTKTALRNHVTSWVASVRKFSRNLDQTSLNSVQFDEIKQI